jgi:hypothetical protein
MDFDNLERLRRARAPKAPKMMAQPLGRLHVVETPAAIAPQSAAIASSRSPAQFSPFLSPVS